MISIHELVNHYLEEFPEERDRLNQLIDLLNKFPNEKSLCDRKKFVGHITASGFVVHRKTHKVLLIYHKHMQMHLQPGGHFESNDISPRQAALREVQEETSLEDLTHVPYHYNPEIPIDIDSHHIPANTEKNEPQHYHHDFRYLFLTEVDEDVPVIQEDEVSAYSWKEIRELQRSGTFEYVVKKIEKVISRELRQRHFYNQILQELSLAKRGNAIVVAHMLPDVLEYLIAVKKVANVLAVIPKPKSIVPNVQQKVQTKFNVLPLTREELRNVESVASLVKHADDPIVIFDIGGWFAPIINDLATKQPGKILGVIEDTENGHQKYAEIRKLNGLKVPVISVARSPLKDNEDFLVGQSILFSADAILRGYGRLIEYLNCSVLGYGKIGRSIAHHLLMRGVKPNVFDSNPIRRIAAYNQLCNIPSEEEFFASSDVIFSATGSQALDVIEFRSLKNGCFIFSVTSSDDEFDLTHVPAEYQRQEVAPYVEKYFSFSNYFYLINSGNAVNFIHEAVLCDFIHLVRAEMLVGYKLIIEEMTKQHGIYRVKDSWRKVIARCWLSTMVGS